MKNLLIVLVALVAFSSCQKRIADLSMVSTRNVDSSKEYKEINRYVTGRDLALNRILLVGPLFAPDIEDAVDRAVKKVEGGEFMMNAVIREYNYPFLLFSLRSFKVVGDVWGIPNSEIVNSQGIKIGDKVIIKHGLPFAKSNIEGEVISITRETVIVKFEHKSKEKIEEFPNEKVIKK